MEIGVGHPWQTDTPPTIFCTKDFSSGKGLFGLNSGPFSKTGYLGSVCYVTGCEDTSLGWASLSSSVKKCWWFPHLWRSRAFNSFSFLLWLVVHATCRSENWWILLTLHLHLLCCLVPEKICKGPPLLHLKSSLCCCSLHICWSLSSEETFTWMEPFVICLHLYHPVYVIASCHNQSQLMPWLPEWVTNFHNICTQVKCSSECWKCPQSSHIMPIKKISSLRWFFHNLHHLSIQQVKLPNCLHNTQFLGIQIHLCIFLLSQTYAHSCSSWNTTDRLYTCHQQTSVPTHSTQQQSFPQPHPS